MSNCFDAFLVLLCKKHVAIPTSTRWRVAQWLEIRWWQRYLASQAPSAYRQQKISYWQRVLQRMDMAPPDEARLLDAGCGPAGIFLAFPRHQVDALDPLLTAYATKLEHFEPSLHPQTNFITQALEELRAEATYDYVFCLNAINHVADWEQSLLRLTVAAKPGATLLLGVDVHNKAWLKAVFRSLPGDVLHPHQHQRNDYRKALEDLGWHIERTHTWSKGIVFDYWLVKAVLRYPEKNRPLNGDGL
ncbi:MAG: class I SAM-dependent methyltransferase [Bacteroidetes bacterium]|nr:MAG: class I SAM-dependent methyltransferase [Bacteroidota bacterium]